MKLLTLKNTYFSIISILLCQIAIAQVGIGTTTPTEALDVVGSIKFTGALKPNDLVGNTNQVLLSAGINNPPVWGLELVNTTEITKLGKFYSGAFDILGTYLILTITDPDCVVTSTAYTSWVGNLPTGANYGDLNIVVEAQNGQWLFHILNNTPFAFTNFQFSYVAAY